MLQQAMSREPDIRVYVEAAKVFRKTLLVVFPKVQPRIYEHALLVHVPDMLREGSLLDGSSWFLEAFNKVWLAGQQNQKPKLVWYSNWCFQTLWTELVQVNICMAQKNGNFNNSLGQR
jgi:hypothetical protein